MADRLKLLSEGQILELHEASLEVLEHTGVKLWEPGAVNLLQKAGADVDAKTGIAKIPDHLVKEALKRAPKEIVLAGRDRQHDLRLGAGRSYFGTLGTAPFVIDLETRERRSATSEDLGKLARIADGLESIDYFHTIVTPSDVPTEVCDLHRWAIALANTTKHLMGGAVYDTANLPFLLRILRAVAGGEEELQRRPLITATECPVSPLQHDKRPLWDTMEFARAKLPVIVYSEPKAGATSPASLAGTLVVTNCEVLSGLTIVQLLSPGAPVIYGSVATLMDMRTGGIAFGSPETGLLAACTTQLAHHYSLPNMTPGGRTDAKLPDAQAGYEKARAALMAALAGGDLANMAGLLESNLTASYEQLVIDDEIIGTTQRILRGVELGPEAMALELIKEAGPGGLFLARRHTLERLKKDHYLSRLSDRTFYSGWVRAGRKELRDTARARAKEILEKHHSEPLDRSVDQEVQAVLREAVKARRRRA